MGEFIKTQVSFANGEVAPEFFARDDINGLSELVNMDVMSGGGLRRRRALRTVATLSGAGRLISFSAAQGEDYILHLAYGHLDIWTADGVRVQSLASPWGVDDIARVQYAQRFGTMIFVHPDYSPYVLSRAKGAFDLVPFDFERDDTTMRVKMPFMRFDDAAGIKITVSKSNKGTNCAVLTTNQDFWTADNVGGCLFLLGVQWVVNEYTNAKSVTAITNENFTIPTTPVSDWQEAAFSPRRGWPISITFHQDRLVFGGSRSWPGGVWLSRVGQHRNFDVGTGLDDEAIFITLMSQRRQQICTVVSSDNLQILTGEGEWAISNKPLTPAAVDIRQHTSVGSLATHYLPPQKIEGQTVFISASGRDIRELSLDELGEKYNANDLCALAKHMMKSPVDIAYDAVCRQLFVVMVDGDVGVLNHNSALGISAWGRYVTAGAFRAAAFCGEQTYFIVEQGGQFLLQCFDDNDMRDGGEQDFEFRAAALPLRAGGHNATRIRIRRVNARVLNTKSLFINGMRVSLPNNIYTDGADGYSGDVGVSQLGTSGDDISVPWVLHGTDPMPAQILSVTIHGRYGV